MKNQKRTEKIEKFASPFYQSNNDVLNKSGSEISMAVYRYEDKSAREVAVTPNENGSQMKLMSKLAAKS